MSHIEKFKNAMRDHGIEPPNIIIDDGAIKRFKINGKNSGWYLLFGGDFYAGSFGCWSTGLKVKWHQDSPVKTIITAQQRADWDKRKKQAEAEKDKLAEYAALKSNHVFKEARKEFRHPYCDNKGIKIDADLNVKMSAGVLLIPIYNRDLQIVNMQTITGDGTKKFQYGGKIKGCFGCVDYNYKSLDLLYIAEGWATAVSVRNYFNKPCFIAFSAGNLMPGAVNLRAIYPDAQIIIAADNDASSIGEKMAISAASAVGGSYIIPSEPGTDFNDIL